MSVFLRMTTCQYRRYTWAISVSWLTHVVNLWHINNINWLAELQPDIANALRAAATLQHYNDGELIFRPARAPRYVYLLESGLARIYRISERGEEVTFGYIRTGEVFGELAAFSSDPRESFAVAVASSTVIRVEREVFIEAIQSNPSVVFNIAGQIEGRFKQIESRVEDLVFRSARPRLAKMLLQLADQFGTSAENNRLIDLKLTHAELATLIGTSRPTVSIALGELEDEEIITRSSGKVVILDEPALRLEANQSG